MSAAPATTSAVRSLTTKRQSRSAPGSHRSRAHSGPKGCFPVSTASIPNGTWTLTVTDDANNDTGLLTGWSLIVTTGERFDVTDANGEYSFDNVAVGNVTIRANKNAGIDWTNPESGKYSETDDLWQQSARSGFRIRARIPWHPMRNLRRCPGTIRNTPVASIDIVFSEPVTGVDVSDFYFTKGGSQISMAGATVSTNDNITWTISNLVGLNTADSTYAIGLNSIGSGIMDAALNPLASFTDPSVNWKIDTVAPVIINLNRTGPATTTASTVSWEYQFSEGVSNLEPEHFALSGSGAAGAKIVSVIGGYVYAQTIQQWRTDAFHGQLHRRDGYRRQQSQQSAVQRRDLHDRPADGSCGRAS